VDPQTVKDTLAGDPKITHVVIVHCETTTGILNPVEEIAAVVKEQKRKLLIDAMSAFGAIPLDARSVPFDAVVASSNKCLEGTPGLGFCIVRQDALEASKGNAHSLSLDLHDQWAVLEKTGQYRFTPPVHTILSFDQALREFLDEGGVAGRGGRYKENCKALVDGMKRLGFQPLLPTELQAPIIVTFLMPQDGKFDFQVFYDALRQKGFVIYPGKLTVAETFRIGCIGRLGTAEISAALAAIEMTLAEMGVADCAPLAA
ncbi:MAG: 2-aminoethylphosphonate--pyruvate transaminase, partial [Hyphomicrobiaceae bacterium]